MQNKPGEVVLHNKINSNLFLCCPKSWCAFFSGLPCCWTQRDAITFRVRKHSLFYRCQLGHAHVETREPSQLLPQTVLGQRQLVAPSGLLESVPIPKRQSFILQRAVVHWNWHLFVLIPSFGSRKFRSLCPFQPFLLWEQQSGKGPCWHREVLSWDGWRS